MQFLLPLLMQFLLPLLMQFLLPLLMQFLLPLLMQFLLPLLMQFLLPLLLQFLLPLLMQFLLIPNRILDLLTQCVTICLVQFCRKALCLQYYDLCLLKLSIKILKSKAVGSDINVLAVRISVCLIPDMIPARVQNTVRIC
jgi:hypothetical protein